MEILFWIVLFLGGFVIGILVGRRNKEHVDSVVILVKEKIKNWVAYLKTKK